MHAPFADRLLAACQAKRNPVCVGLDPRWASLPEALVATVDDTPAGRATAFSRFCREVVDVVAPLVPVVKPQVAFFEQLGPAGMTALAEVVQHCRSQGLLVVIDGKRNDIGSTAEAYADGWLGAESVWGGDALTVSPYLGHDSLEPFVATAQSRGGGLFVLVKTSNPGGGQFQDLTADGKMLYCHVADYVERLSAAQPGTSGYGAVGAVVGATYPEQLAELRHRMPHTLLLVPGYGSQGGGARDVAAAFDDDGLGAIINNSRGIIFAYRNPRFASGEAASWQSAVEAATRDMIDQLRAETTVSRLAT